MKGIIIAGIDTEIGKSVVSLVMSNAFDFAYWKPIQSGDLENSDSVFVRKYSKDNLTILPEHHRFTQPVSPHQAAQIDGVDVRVSDFELPTSQKTVLVESAGGIMSPISLEACNLDLFAQLNLPVVLVVKNYLGSINHTLMSLKLLKEKLKVVGIVISGESNESSEDAYEVLGNTKILYRLPKIELSKANVQIEAEKMKKSLSATFAAL